MESQTSEFGLGEEIPSSIEGQDEIFGELSKLEKIREKIIEKDRERKIDKTILYLVSLFSWCTGRNEVWLEKSTLVAISDL